MSKASKVFSCIQIFILLSLLFFRGGVTISHSGTSDAFSCEGHQCGCTSEYDCRTHCCCSPHDNPSLFQNNEQTKKNGLQSFISSIKCKSGSDVITIINAECKYLLGDNFPTPQITFLCFLTGNTLARLSEPMVFPPEKPPRRLT